MRIIFADLPPEKEEEVRRYFLDLAEKVVSGLERCGFPRCKGGIMAVNPKWCQPFQVWKEYYRHWIIDFDYPAEEILETLSFSISAPSMDQYDFVTEGNGVISDASRCGEAFLREMAKTAIPHKTPLGFSRGWWSKNPGSTRISLT